MPFSKVSELEKSFPSVKNLTPEQKDKVLDIFNALKKEGMKDGQAIAIAISRAKLSENIKMVLSEILFGEITDDDLENTEFEILKVGQAYDPRYGKFEVTEDLLLDLKNNFDENVLEVDVAVDTNHDPTGGARAWIFSLEVRNGSLFARLKDFSEEGKRMLKEKIFKYFSVEFAPFKKVINGKLTTFKNVLRGLALTNRPVIKGMAPTFMSENVQLLFNHRNMDTFKVFAEALLKKDSISPEDLETLKAMFAKLSEEEQAEAQESISEAEDKVDVIPEKTPEEEEDKETPAEDPVVPVEELAEDTKLSEQIKAQEKELSELRERENARILQDRISSLYLSEDNLTGFVKTEENKTSLSEFISSLDEAQFSQFQSLLGKATSMSKEQFAELGHGENIEEKKLSEEEELDQAAKDMSEKEKIPYNEALRRVLNK